MRFCLDRREGPYAVCLCEEPGREREPLVLPLSDYPILKDLAEGTLFDAEQDAEGKLTDITPAPEATEVRRAAARSRLHALAARHKKKGDR